MSIVLNDVTDTTSTSPQNCVPEYPCFQVQRHAYKVGPDALHAACFQWVLYTFRSTRAKWLLPIIWDACALYRSKNNYLWGRHWDCSTQKHLESLQASALTTSPLKDTLSIPTVTPIEINWTCRLTDELPWTRSMLLVIWALSAKTRVTDCVWHILFTPSVIQCVHYLIIMLPLVYSYCFWVNENWIYRRLVYEVRLRLLT